MREGAMNKYDQVLNTIVDVYRKDDEKDRKSKGLSKVRSDFEAIQYRRHFDECYHKATNDLALVIKSGVGELSDSPIASSFAHIDRINQHDFLNDLFVLPHALTKLLDYQTNSGGKIDDIAKICNLFALTATVHTFDYAGSENTKLEFARAYFKLIASLKSLNIATAPFSDGGMKTTNFLYWLIYDNSSCQLNLDILIHLANATKGSIVAFKIYLSAYWLAKSSDPYTSVKFFYSEILPNVK